MANWRKHLKNDIPASLVVFLVALPLCIGIALASNAPLMAGIISGIVGGIVVGVLSGSSLSVSGPAASLTTVVISSLEKLPSYEVFLVAVLIAGVIQLIFGFAKLGAVGNYVPSPVIKGMLAAIGIILILKQIPHALGYDSNYEGIESFKQPDGSNTFSTIWFALRTFRPAAGIITLITIGILMLWELKAFKKRMIFQIIPGALVAVITAVLLNTYWFPSLGEDFALAGNHLASIPKTGSFPKFADGLKSPDFSGFASAEVWSVSVTIALVASLASLLSVEAVDKLDPEKNITNKNTELKAQGVGNILSGLLGGLPITAVIIRSSANVNAGAKTKLSAIFHGILLLVCVIYIAPILNLIPLSSLAGILFFIGYKLTSPKIIKSIASKGRMQLIPFFITIFAILITDLLSGIIVGLMVGLFFTIKANKLKAVTLTVDGDNYLLRFRRDVTFLNIKEIKDYLSYIPVSSKIIIDAENTGFIDPDVVEQLHEFYTSAPSKGMKIVIKGKLKEILENY